MKKHLDHGDMVANILAYWDGSTPAQRAAGASWYTEAGRIADLIAEATGTDTRRVVMAISALSPRNPWRWNVFDAYSFASARAQGREMPTATTFRRNRAAAWRALDPNTDQPWLTAAPKVRAFVEAILGDTEAVVVDTWAARAATGGAVSNGRGISIGIKAFAAIAHAYTVAASLRGIEPSTLQATVWLVVQTEGLGTARRSRHDLTYKAGTPEWMKEAING